MKRYARWILVMTIVSVSMLMSCGKDIEYDDEVEPGPPQEISIKVLSGPALQGFSHSMEIENNGKAYSYITYDINKQTDIMSFYINLANDEKMVVSLSKFLYNPETNKAMDLGPSGKDNRSNLRFNIADESVEFARYLESKSGEVTIKDVQTKEIDKQDCIAFDMTFSGIFSEYDEDENGNEEVVGEYEISGKIKYNLPPEP